MARTSEGLSFVAADVDIKQYEADDWLSLSCFATSIAVSGGDRATGEVNVFCDERPIVKAGKKASQDLTVRFVYTEVVEDGDSDTGWTGTHPPFQTIRIWDDTEGGEMWVRYFPAGRVVGNYVFETGSAIITSFLDPGGEAGSGDPVLGEFTVKTEELTKEAWGGS